MQTEMPQQGMPIIIKGRNGGIAAKAIEIDTGGSFQITEQFQSQPENWIQSSSDFNVSYVESVMVGEMGSGLEFCQTASMAHPLTFIFKDSNRNNIFTLREIADGGNYSLQIAVDMANDYFQITEGAPGAGNKWTGSTFNTTDAEIYEVEVTDAGGTPVCQLTTPNGENITLNLEPAV